MTIRTNAFPIPNGRAEECARDLAADIRSYGPELMRLQVAVSMNEASADDKKKLAEMKENIRAMASIICVCAETGTEYRVGDYVTKRNELIAAWRDTWLYKQYENLRRFLQ